MTDRAPSRPAKPTSPTIETASVAANSSFSSAASTRGSRRLDVVDATDPPLADADGNAYGDHSLNGDYANVSGSERSASAPAYDAADGGKDHKKKIRRRRGHGRRKWKPYHKLSTEEKRELEVREEKRAEKSRAERYACFLPLFLLARSRPTFAPTHPRFDV